MLIKSNDSSYNHFPSFCLSMHLSIYVHHFLSIFVSLSHSLYLCVCVTLNLCISLSFLSLYLSFNLSPSLYLSPKLYLSIYLSIYHLVSIYLPNSINLSACLTFFYLSASLSLSLFLPPNFLLKHTPSSKISKVNLTFTFKWKSANSDPIQSLEQTVENYIWVILFKCTLRPLTPNHDST